MRWSSVRFRYSPHTSHHTPIYMEPERKEIYDILYKQRNNQVKVVRALLKDASFQKKKQPEREQRQIYQNKTQRQCLLHEPSGKRRRHATTNNLFKKKREVHFQHRPPRASPTAKLPQGNGARGPAQKRAERSKKGRTVDA